MGSDACWLDSTCAECGRFVEDRAASTCPRCGARLEDLDDRAPLMDDSPTGDVRDDSFDAHAPPGGAS